MSFLQPSDFTGVKAVSTNEFTEDPVQAYIDKWEPLYLKELLGVDLYDEFIADLDTAPNITPTSVPTDPKFTVIFNAFSFDDGSSIRISDGMKEMLRLMIYFDYVRDVNFEVSITGATTGSYSNSEVARIVETRAIENWNEGIKSYCNIQWYIDDNPNDYDYSLENMQPKKTISWL